MKLRDAAGVEHDEPDEDDDVVEVYPLEYVEEWALVSKGWGELLNKYGADGWRLRFVLLDEVDDEGNKHPGRRRLIFERIAAGDEA